MRILYVAMAHDYGRPELGPSFEEFTFRSSLEALGHELIAFDFKAREMEIGREPMQRELVALAGELRPDLAFFFLFEDELPPAAVAAVGHEGRTVTMNWFADDHWRFDAFSRHYANVLDWIVTTDHTAVERYRQIGHDRVILSQWACNHHAFKKTADGLEHDVSFVGMPHGNRRGVIQRLQDAGFQVEAFGRDWPGGRVQLDEMVRIFGSSRVNLNLSNSSDEPHLTLRARVGALLGRGPRVPRGPRPSQIKGRTFEVPGSGGFLLTERAPHLEKYFEIGHEIAVFDSEATLHEQVRYWLAHEDERAAVAEAGYRRVLAEHTYDHRFARIFETAGLT